MQASKTLNARHHRLADPRRQLEVLQDTVRGPHTLFEDRLKEAGLLPLRPTVLDTLQINLGKMCNQTCKHCHVDAGPDRKEIMTRETMQACLDLLARTEIPVVDLTGGAPEMNPHFRWLVEELSRLERKVLVRCNLTILVANKNYQDLPEFYRQHGVEVVSSLPFYSKDRTDRQRGAGVFDASVEALRRLNTAGYGQMDSGLILDLVYNPAGAFLPPDQHSLESEYKRELEEHFGIVFNHLFVLTNMPISRYLDYLLESGNFESYMQKLVQAFNPAAAQRVMCRNTLSVGWDGMLYDCDFNQMLGLPVSPAQNRHITDVDIRELEHRDISVGQHCFGCTAGSGSSCGGQVT